MSILFIFQRFILFGLLFIQISCARNPVTGKKQLVLMSEKQEVEMGKSSDPEIMAFFGRYDDPDLQAFITEKGNEMAAVSHRPKLDYEFKIVDSPVINAFAVPGGFVYFTRGIMAHFNNEAEFAGVLGHEIGHVTARHSVIQQRNAMLGQLGMIAGIVLVPQLSEFVEPLSQGMQLALLSFGRDAERQSDELGVEYSSKIGYDAVEMAGFFETLERQQTKEGGSPVPEFLSTHPSPAERNVTVAQLAQNWKEKLDLNETKVNRESYLKRIAGLVYGEDPRQGFVEKQVFYHPELKFNFPIPKEWSLQNSPQQVQMAPESGEAVMSLTLGSGENLRELADQMVEQYQLEVLSVTDLLGAASPDLTGFTSLKLRAAPPGAVNERTFVSFEPGLWMELASQRTTRGQALCYKGLIGMVLHSEQPPAQWGEDEVAMIGVLVAMTDRIAAREVCLVYDRKGEAFSTRSFLPDGRPLPNVDADSSPLTIMPASALSAFIRERHRAAQE